MFLRKNSKGQSLVEYGLILALVAVLCIPALEGIQSGVDSALGKSSTALAGTSGGNSPPIVAEPAEAAVAPPAVS